jgi:hypothetical protein
VPTFDDGDDQHCFCNEGWVGLLCDIKLTAEIGDSLARATSFTFSNGSVAFLTSTLTSAFNRSTDQPTLTDTLLADGRAAGLPKPQKRAALANAAVRVAVNRSILVTTSANVELKPVNLTDGLNTTSGLCNSLDACGFSTLEQNTQQMGSVVSDPLFTATFTADQFFFPGAPVVVYDEHPNGTIITNITNSTVIVQLDSPSNGGPSLTIILIGVCASVAVLGTVGGLVYYFRSRI